MTTMQLATIQTYERETFRNENGAFNKTPLSERLHGSDTARPTTHHWSFQRYLKTFGLITMVGASVTLAMPIGKAQARGEFSKTCTNLSLGTIPTDPHAVTLYGHCGTGHNGGVNNQARINLNDYVTNRYGYLKWATHGDFGDTCFAYLRTVNNTVSAIMDGTCLYPNPPTGQSPYIASSIDLDEHIANIFGNLKYVP